MTANPFISDITPMSKEEGRSRRKTSITIGLILAFLVASFYVVTLVRLKGNVDKRHKIETTGGSTSKSTPASKAPASAIKKQGQ